ncbi:RNA polymerase I subunit RpI12 [Leptinotarsa decemlineata]|uniref:RNA polymerase I subunit RpI12 n=1 Tax=Leptinotarsa decemlineata TaxID=7539 RepID=UPI000C25452C|nr:DNA-directed RNA polymerase I subunit RPA12 [Leptinotarsa decemlineata]
MSSFFVKTPGFCDDCGSILPRLREKGGVTCYVCARVFSEEEAFRTSKVETCINFNSQEAKKRNIKEENKHDEEDDDGPIVERICPKCGNNRMSYATLQLRSADEGQTVFYTCTSCKFKESENS